MPRIHQRRMLLEAIALATLGGAAATSARAASHMAASAVGLILEFDGIGRDVYDAVNKKLGIDTTRPTGNWPPGLMFHAGGAKPGGWVVFEVWQNKEAQERFMSERLGKALQEGGITKPPSRVEWLMLAAHTAPQR